MVVLLSYVAVAAAFYLAGMQELRRTRVRAPFPHDSTDGFILHVVAILAALLWVVALPFLLRALVRRLRPRQALARVTARIVARLPRRRTRLAG